MSRGAQNREIFANQETDSNELAFHRTNPRLVGAGQGISPNIDITHFKTGTQLKNDTSKKCFKFLSADCFPRSDNVQFPPPSVSDEYGTGGRVLITLVAHFSLT